MKKILFYILINITIFVLLYAITIKTLKINNIQVEKQGQLITVELLGQQFDYYYEY